MTINLYAPTYALSKSMLVHEEVTVSNSLCSLFPVITYIFNGNCVLVIDVQLQLLTCMCINCNFV